MSKISEYGNYDTGKSPSEVATFQATGVLPVSGKYADNGNMTTKNVKLSDLVGGGGGGDADSLAGRGLHASDGKLTVDTDDTLNIKIVDVGYSETRYKVSVKNAVPAPGNNEHRGEYLKVADDSDSLVWDSPAVPEISQYNGDLSVVSATNDVSSGGYVFDVNLDSDTLEKRSTEGANQVSYIAVKNPVPPTTDASDGDVLTYDASDGIVWAAPQGGGGGGGSDMVYLDLTVQLVNDDFHLTSASMTPQAIMAAIESGKSVIARTFKYQDNVITHSTQLTLGDYYNGAPYGDGYKISFGAAGSGFWDANLPYIAIMTTRGSLEWVSSGLWDVSDLDGQ